MVEQLQDGASPEGMSRRTLLRRGAVVGGTLLWAAPAVQSFPRAAWGAVGSPVPKDLSYVAFCYTCNGQRCCVKFELNDDGFATDCEAGSFGTPQCSFTADDTVDCGDCSLFDVTSPDGGMTVTVSFKAGVDPTCTIEMGQGVGKCGNPEQPQSGGACIDGTVGAGGRSITFAMCL